MGGHTARMNEGQSLSAVQLHTVTRHLPYAVDSLTTCFDLASQQDGRDALTSPGLVPDFWRSN
jgi:hypothetical protein